MQLFLKSPGPYYVIITSNIFGDILSDEASIQLLSSIGMLASASLREQQARLYEPIHGSAPSIAGQVSRQMPLLQFFLL